jgi:hypothetical protein
VRNLSEKKSKAKERARGMTQVIEHLQTLVLQYTLHTHTHTHTHTECFGNAKRRAQSDSIERETGFTFTG